MIMTLRVIELCLHYCITPGVGGTWWHFVYINMLRFAAQTLTFKRDNYLCKIFSSMVLAILYWSTLCRHKCMITCSMFYESSPKSHIWASTMFSMYRCAFSLLWPVLALISLTSRSLGSVDLYFPCGTVGRWCYRNQLDFDLSLTATWYV